MANEIVVSSQSSPPLRYMTPTLADKLSAWFTALLTATIFAKIFSNEITVAPGISLGDLTECTSPGYAPKAVTVINGPYLDAQGNAYGITNQLLFTTTGGGTDLGYGVYLVEATGAAATATFTESGGAYTAPVITSGGSGYLVPPRVTVTGATGSGAHLTADITDGVVTGINIVSPGTGYTTATATIEPPVKLITAANFPGPLPLVVSTDAIPVVVELDEIAAV